MDKSVPIRSKISSPFQLFNLSNGTEISTLETNCFLERL